VRPVEGVDEASLSRDLRFLLRMQKATHYTDWIVRLAAPYPGGRVLEVGPGLGIVTERIYQGRVVTCAEIDQMAAEIMRSRFTDVPAVRVIDGNIENDDWRSGTGVAEYDRAVCVNVLEHVADDLAGLRNMRAALRPGGHMFLFVPALMALYGSLDRAVGHERRYSVNEVKEKAQAAGFDIVSVRYANLLGALGWFWSSRITRRSMPGTTILRMFDPLVPIWAAVESRISIPFGMSVVCVARNGPDEAPGR